MASVDEPRDEDAPAADEGEESVLPSGPTRSTYQPPKSPSADDAELPPPPPVTPAAVLYQLDDIEPEGVFGVSIEHLDAGPPGARIPLADEAAAAAGMPSPGASSTPFDLPPPSSAPSAPSGSQTDDEPTPAPVSEPDRPVFDLEADEPSPPQVFAEHETASPAPPIPEFAAPEPPQDSPAPPQPAAEPVPAQESASPAFDEPPTADDATSADDSPVAMAEPFGSDPQLAQRPRRRKPGPSHAAPDSDSDAGNDFADASVQDAAPPDLTLSPEEQAAALAAHSAPAGQPWVPQRRSLRDDELGALLNQQSDQLGDTLDVMQELERQLVLRDEETREFQEWQRSMLAVGTPEALAAVERVTPEFTDLLTAAAKEEPPRPAPAAQSEQQEAPRPPLEQAPPPPMPQAPQPPLSQAPPPPMPQAPPPPMPQAPPPPMPQAPPPGPPPPPTAPPRLDAPPPPMAPPEPWDIPDGNVIPEEFEREVPLQPSTPPVPPLVEPAPFGSDPNFSPITTGSIPVITGSIPVITGSIPVPTGSIPTGSIPTTTGSVPIPVVGLDVDDRGVDDAVDATDLVGAAAAGHPATAPVVPIVTPRVANDENVLDSEQHVMAAVAVPEHAGVQPTPLDQRAGRAIRMFWMWVAANSSLVSIAFGVIIFSIGMSLRQAMVGVVVGVAISLLPLGLSSLAGKRSGQPTMVISRAVFGTGGNVLPALVGLVSRAFWGAALLWILGQAVAAILVGAELTGGLAPDILSYITMAIGLVIAIVVAALGYRVIATLTLIIGIASLVMVSGVIALTWQYVDFSAAISHPDMDWIAAVTTTTVLVFSFVGLLWANSGADLARYQRSGASGAGSGALAAIGAALPAAVLIAYGSLLAASNDVLAAGLLTNPFDTIGRMLPVWYPVPLLAAVGLSLIVGVVITLYSGAFAFQAIIGGASRSLAMIVTTVVVVAVAGLLVTGGIDLSLLFRDISTTIAVPVAAWAGIFAADTMIRNRSYDSDALLKPGGIYPTVRSGNLVLFVVLTAVGLGLTSGTVSWLSWQGYLLAPLGIDMQSVLAASDFGVLVALIGGVLFGILTGIGGIRKQEAVARRQTP
jgi:purine-cytosine permease-like protein